MPNGESSTHNGGWPVRVLVVDDHPAMRAVARELIAGLDGFEYVAGASTGEAAMPLVERLRPDLVLVDLQLPGIDGIEVTLQLTARVPLAVVLLMSADPDALSTAAAAGCAAAALLPKQNLRRHTLRELWQRHRRDRPPPATA